ncbi:MAG: imelysin family protein [Pseudomonadota bacterium]
MHRLLIAILCVWPLSGFAGPQDLVTTALDRHILPGFQTLATEGAALADAAGADCSVEGEALVQAYHSAFDAWLGVSHLRFGPTEVDNRGFGLAFWPDPRGKTVKSLATLVRDQDPVIDQAATFATVSVAARGFYAMERLLFEPGLLGEDAAYGCALVRAVATDIAVTTAALRDDWEDRYADTLRQPGSEGSPYATPTEGVRELFKALSTGLEFAADVRLARPLGTFERPRPRRAEARLSGRSLRQVVLSLDAMEALADILAAEHSAVAQDLATAFAAADEAAARIDDPTLAQVADVQGRIQVEALQQRVNEVRNVVRGQLGPALGVGAGFNALDGD